MRLPKEKLIASEEGLVSCDSSQLWVEQSLQSYRDIYMLFPQLYSLDKLIKKAEKAPKVWIKVREFEPQSQLPPDTFK
jgi:hypothetical protein